MAYFVGMLGNLLPLPGGVGGVEGGMIGAFAANTRAALMSGRDGRLEALELGRRQLFALELDEVPAVRGAALLRGGVAPGGMRCAALQRLCASSHAV